MNNNSKSDLLPKLMTSHYKLLEPIHIKNTQLKVFANESKVMPSIQRSSVNYASASPRQLVVQRLINCLDFSSRHFGAACDRGFQGLSKYHYSQKFGHSSVRLEPLNRQVMTELTDAEDTEEIPKEERTYYKKIYKFQNMPILALIKSFEIEWVREFEDEVNKKANNPLSLSFYHALAILNTHKEPIEFFKKNLQKMERTVSLKNKGMGQLKNKVRHFDNEEFQRMVVLKNQSGQGYFRIYFPTIILYVQEYQHNQTIDLSPLRLYEIVKNNFFEMASIVEQFDMYKFQLYINSQSDSILQQLEEPNNQSQQQSINQQQIENQSQSQTRRQSQTKLEEQMPTDQKSKNEQIITTKPVNTDLSIVIVEEKHEYLDKLLAKRCLKKIAVKNDVYYTIDFLPCQILVREKVSKLIIRMYSPTLKEFDAIIHLTNTIKMLEILDNYLDLSFNLQPEDFAYKEFKKGTKVSMTLPEITDQPLEITQEQLENGLLESWTKEIEINNKDLQIIIEPPQLEIYNPINCSMIKRICDSQELTKILQHRYSVALRLV